MTTPTLTHEQAAVMRAVVLTEKAANGQDVEFDPDMLKLLPPEMVHYDSHCQFSSQAGRDALAKYDVEWRTVRTEALAVAIENLEASISRHNELFAGYPTRLALIDDDRVALAELKAALAMEAK